MDELVRDQLIVDWWYSSGNWTEPPFYISNREVRLFRWLTAMRADKV